MVRSRLALWLALFVALSSTVVAGCRPAPAQPTMAPGSGASTAAPSPTPGTPQRGGTLVVAVAADPDGLDPHKTVAAATFQITRNIYDTLVQTDEKGRIVPDLALSWAPSADGLTWTFTLRQGVRFHNGRTMTAADVKYSFERLLAPETASPRAKDFAVIKSIAAPDDKTVVFELKSPSAAFLSNLAYGWAAIVPQEAAATLRDHPVGTGPFQFVEWVKDSHVALKRFDGYFLPGVPYLDAATFRVITDPAARMAALRAGEVDVIPELPAQDVAAVRQDPDLNIIEVSTNARENRDNLILEYHRGVLSLLQDLDHTRTSSECSLCCFVQVGTELGKRLKRTEVREVELQATCYLLHSFGLCVTTYTGY